MWYLIEAKTRLLEAKKVLDIADSCYLGIIFKGLDPKKVVREGD